MIIVYLERLNAFAKNYADAGKSFSTWKKVTEKAIWKSKQQVLFDFSKAEFLKNNRSRFEILHNTYRLIVRIDYVDAIIYMRFIGTHNEYDKVDPETV